MSELAQLLCDPVTCPHCHWLGMDTGCVPSVFLPVSMGQECDSGSLPVTVRYQSKRKEITCGKWLSLLAPTSPSHSHKPCFKNLSYEEIWCPGRALWGIFVSVLRTVAWKLDPHCLGIDQFLLLLKKFPQAEAQFSDLSQTPSNCRTGVDSHHSRASEAT